jgi:hypothetical protein
VSLDAIEREETNVAAEVDDARARHPGETGSYLGWRVVGARWYKNLVKDVDIPCPVAKDHYAAVNEIMPSDPPRAAEQLVSSKCCRGPEHCRASCCADDLLGRRSVRRSAEGRNGVANCAGIHSLQPYRLVCRLWREKRQTTTDG